MEKVKPSFERSFKSPQVVPFEKGKLPPQAIDLEEVVLGAMMIDKKGVDAVIDILHSEAFYKESHQYIFQSIVKLFENTEPIDLLTVSSKLKSDGKLEKAGGEYYLVQLTQKVSSSAHIEYHARIILQKYIQRSLIRISTEIIEESYDETKDVFNLLDKAESKLYDVTQGNIKKSTETAQSLVIQAKKKIEEISNKDGLSGIPSGFSELDKLTSGWQPSDLVIIAARPGMGKTCLNFINGQKYGSCSKYSYSILFFRDVLNSINYKINFIRDWTIF
jgi:replicative DNA helicase